MFPQYFESIPAVLTTLFEDTTYPWQALERLTEFFADRSSSIPSGLHPSIVIEGNVVIGEGATIESGVVIKGPTIIGSNCIIRAGAYIRGNVVTGDRCVIGHTTELIRCILFNDVRVDHFNYVSDSVLGNSVHFGAGAKIANLRFDQKEIVVGDIPTGRKKFGAVLGDHCQIGVNTVVGPGVVFEKNCWWASGNLLPSGIYNREAIRPYITL